MSHADPPRQRPLARESGFWRRLQEQDAMRQTDILRLRDDLLRLEEMTKQAGEGKTGCADVAREIERVRESAMKDYATHALVLQTLIEVLLAKGIMTEDEFADTLDAVDARDGVRDGMLRPTGAAPAGRTRSQA